MEIVMLTDKRRMSATKGWHDQIVTYGSRKSGQHVLLYLEYIRTHTSPQKSK